VELLDDVEAAFTGEVGVDQCHIWPHSANRESASAPLDATPTTTMPSHASRPRGVDEIRAVISD
jgi:hypothetical protein